MSAYAVNMLHSDKNQITLDNNMEFKMHGEEKLKKLRSVKEQKITCKLAH